MLKLWGAAGHTWRSGLSPACLVPGSAAALCATTPTLKSFLLKDEGTNRVLYVNQMAKTNLHDLLTQELPADLKCLQLGLLGFSSRFGGVSLSDVQEHVSLLKFVACARSAPLPSWVEAACDSSAELPEYRSGGHVTGFGPLPQEP